MTKRAIAGMALVIFILVLLWLARPAMIVDRKEDRVRVQLQMVSVALKDYAEKHQQFPNSGEGLRVLLTRGYFNHSALVDAWGNPLRYSCTDSGCRRSMVWSSGPGGIDESGKGDDIALVVEATGAEGRPRSK